MFFYTDKDGNVKMKSEQRIIAPNFTEHEIIPTPDELDKINKNAKQKIKNGKLELTDVKPLPTEDSQNELKKILKDKVKYAKNVTDLQDVLNNLLA